MTEPVLESNFSHSIQWFNIWQNHRFLKWIQYSQIKHFSTFQLASTRDPYKWIKMQIHKVGAAEKDEHDNYCEFFHIG